MTPSDHTREVADVFDDWAERGRGEGMEEGHRLTAGELIARLPIQPGQRFLDLGTGIGWAARDVAAKGGVSVGVDIAPKMLSRARQRQGPPVDYARASFEALPFQDEAFHQAFSMEALYYAKDLAAALAEAARVMAPGGQLHVLVDYYAENTASHGWPEKTGVPMHLLSEVQWCLELEEAGFGEVTSRRLRAPEGTAEAWKIEEGSLYLVATKPEA